MGLVSKFQKLPVGIRATCISGGFTLLGVAITLGFNWWLKDPPRVETTTFVMENGETHLPLLEKLTKEQMTELSEMKYRLTLKLRNDTTGPMLNVVVLVPTHGILEILDGGNNSSITELKKSHNGRIDFPAIAPL